MNVNFDAWLDPAHPRLRHVDADTGPVRLNGRRDDPAGAPDSAPGTDRECVARVALQRVMYRQLLLSRAERLQGLAPLTQATGPRCGACEACLRLPAED